MKSRYDDLDPETSLKRPLYLATPGNLGKRQPTKRPRESYCRAKSSQILLEIRARAETGIAIP